VGLDHTRSVKAGPFVDTDVFRWQLKVFKSLQAVQMHMQMLLTARVSSFPEAVAVCQNILVQSRHFVTMEIFEAFRRFCTRPDIFQRNLLLCERCFGNWIDPDSFWAVRLNRIH
jgi:hypothetical protein